MEEQKIISEQTVLRQSILQREINMPGGMDTADRIDNKNTEDRDLKEN